MAKTRTRTRITTGGGRVTAGQAQALIDYLPDDAPALPLLPPVDALAPELAWLAPDWDGVYAPAPELPDTPEMPPDMPESAQDALGGAGDGKDADLPIGVNDAPPAPTPAPPLRDVALEFGVCQAAGCGRVAVRAGRCQFCGHWQRTGQEV